ncbi:MAG: D-glycero-beta-D-manno-heptose 1,7-bisphosphate 7-phosphatase [Rhodobacteraceae bacterium]|nr:D-glycero-beta-D-manno-heptose 1,7-bisphosphate 7-phosphatase [Paracoccaceae bacterium]
MVFEGKEPRAAVFLDRDGTVNVDKGYVHKIADWEWIPGAIEAIGLLNRSGYLVVVVTNQAGIARGYYNHETVAALHQHVDSLLKAENCWINAYYLCPHHPEYGSVRECNCRKPLPGMLLQAAQDLNIDMSRSWLIGDKLSDTEAGFAAGVSPILVRTGYGDQEREMADTGVQCEADLLRAVRSICSLENPQIK